MVSPCRTGGRVIYHMGDKPHAIPLSCCNQALSYKVSKTASGVIHIKDLDVDPFWPGTGQTTCNDPGAILRTNRPRCRDERKMEHNEMLVLFGYDADVSGNLPVQLMYLQKSTLYRYHSTHLLLAAAGG